MYALLLFALHATSAVHACHFDHNVRRLDTIDFQPIIASNIAARSSNYRRTPTDKFAILNARVFDGTTLQPPQDIIIDGDKIGKLCAGRGICDIPTEFYDAQGKTLLPGLIDSHAHPSDVTDLTNLTRYGVTTTVDAFCASPAMCASLQNHTGLTSLVKASFIATSPNSPHAQLVGALGDPYFIHNVSQVDSFVTTQVEEGCDFIKVIGSAPDPGLTQAEQTALVQASHRAGKQVILHTASYEAYREGLVAGVDQIHHAPLDTPADDRLITMFKWEGTVVCPTLTRMRAVIQQEAPANSSFLPATETVTRLHRAGIPILAGTDGNMASSAPATVEFGISLHDELQNLVAAGLSPIEALNAATALPAKYFGLKDRGAVREGMRADLLLVDGDPTVNIRATKDIAAVWVGGLRFSN